MFVFLLSPVAFLLMQQVPRHVSIGSVLFMNGKWASFERLNVFNVAYDEANEVNAVFFAFAPAISIQVLNETRERSLRGPS